MYDTCNMIKEMFHVINIVRSGFHIVRLNVISFRSLLIFVLVNILISDLVNVCSLATQPLATLHIKSTNIISPFIQLVINKRDERLQVNERIIWHSPINHKLSN